MNQTKKVLFHGAAMFLSLDERVLSPRLLEVTFFGVKENLEYKANNYGTDSNNLLTSGYS